MTKYSSIVTAAVMTQMPIVTGSVTTPDAKGVA
jgi:hypothetical protein